jgi:tetratricopeptide (TPR) repeat protein
MRMADALAVARRALTVLGDDASPDRARLVGLTATALSGGGDYAAGKDLFAQARALAEQAGSERALADVLHMQTLHHMAHLEFPEGVRVGLRAAEIFEREGALWDLCSAQAFVVFQDGIMGSRQQADRLADQAMVTAERLGHLGAMYNLLFDRARLRASLGDLASVETAGLQIIDVCERGGLPFEFIGHDFVALAAHWRGHATRAEEEFRRAISLEPPGVFAGTSAPLLARHLAHSGRADEVLRIYESARSQIPSTDRLTGVGAWSCMLGMVEPLYSTGYRTEAAALSPLVEEALERGPDWITLDCQLVRTRAGVVATAARRWDDAERHFTAAETHARSMSNELAVAEAHWLHARMLLDRARPDDTPKATQLLTEAHSAYTRFGMPSYVAEVEQMLGAAPLVGP